MTTDLNELSKEVYARFGLAYYLSECLHNQVCITHVICGFRGPKDATRPRVEQKMKWAYRQMMGPLVEAIRPHIPPECDALLAQALQRRNKIAHGFWSEKIHLMGTEDGMHSLLAELQEVSDVISAADAQLTQVYQGMRHRLGITDEAEKQCWDAILAGETEPPLPSKRLPKKEERILRVWIAPHDGGTSAVFETEDGLYLAPCEDGLGWSAYETQAPDWTIHEKLQSHLPANVGTKPPIKEAWHYDLRLKGAILEVSKPADSSTCQFRLKRYRTAKA